VQNDGMMEILFGLSARVDLLTDVLDGSTSPHVKEQFLGERTCWGMLDDNLPWAVQKWLNRSRSCLGCGLGWARWSMWYNGAHWRHPANMIERPCMAAMPCVKLLW